MSTNEYELPPELLKHIGRLTPEQMEARKSLTFPQVSTNEYTPTEALARTIDPDAFEHHDIEARSSIAAIQWSARRHMAGEAAAKIIGSGWLAGVVADAKTEALEEAKERVRKLLSDPTIYSSPAIIGVVEALASLTDEPVPSRVVVKETGVS
jgi:hypothetical protein